MSITKNVLLKGYFSMKMKKIERFTSFLIQKIDSESQIFALFLTTGHYISSQNTIISFWNIYFQPKTNLILYLFLGNSTTNITISSTVAPALFSGPLNYVQYICILYRQTAKAELPQEGILFHTQFPSLGIFINKKVGYRKN